MALIAKIDFDDQTLNDSTGNFTSVGDVIGDVTLEPRGDGYAMSPYWGACWSYTGSQSEVGDITTIGVDLLAPQHTGGVFSCDIGKSPVDDAGIIDEIDIAHLEISSSEGNISIELARTFWETTEFTSGPYSGWVHVSVVYNWTTCTATVIVNGATVGETGLYEKIPEWLQKNGYDLSDLKPALRNIPLDDGGNIRVDNLHDAVLTENALFDNITIDATSADPGPDHAVSVNNLKTFWNKAKTYIPGKTSDLANDSGFLTSADISGKQDALSADQLAAVNSGVTSATVAQVAANTSAIAGKQDIITWSTDEDIDALF